VNEKQQIRVAALQIAAVTFGNYFKPRKGALKEAEKIPERLRDRALAIERFILEAKEQ